MQADFFTTSQAAKYLHVTRFTVLNWIKQGKLPAVSTLGGHQRIAKALVLSAAKFKRSNGLKLPPATRQVSANLLAPVPVKRSAPVRSKNNPNIVEVLKKGAFSSGKYIAAITHKFNHNNKEN
ncbi:MAG: excisionase family DNA-binding protein [Candidatus Omnitrophica bacterium]|nr:excisionase family DNA-binding protein [Candidatus Omnitrophota bacterium]